MQTKENNKKTTNSSLLSYETIEKKLMQEAESLIPETILQQTLAEEKNKFEHAQKLNISPAQVIGNNTLRYCKDTLRKKQPFSFLYFTINFITELSIFMIVYGFLMGMYHYCSGKNFLDVFPVAYVFLGILCILLFVHHKRKVLLKNLSTDVEELNQIKFNIQKDTWLFLLPCVLLMGIGSFLIYSFHWNTMFKFTLLQCVMAYIVCILLGGIHNTLYSSHFIPFVAIGAFKLTRRSAEEIDSFTQQYLNLSYMQLLAHHKKTLHDFNTDESLQRKLQNELHARMITHRVYYVLAIFILALLDGLCIWQLTQVFSVAFAVFLCCALLVTAVFIIVFLSANHVIKKTIFLP